MTDDLVKQPALRRWQESVYGKGPYQVPDYESMAAIVQEHEQMADRIEELESKLSKAVAGLEKAKTFFQVTHCHAAIDTALAELKGEDRG